MAFPYLEIGAGGVLALLIIKEVRHWTTSIINKKNILNNKNNKSKRLFCINTPEVKQAFTENALMKASVERMETTMNRVKEESIKQTSQLKQLSEATKEQTEATKAQTEALSRLGDKRGE